MKEKVVKISEANYEYVVSRLKYRDTFNKGFCEMVAAHRYFMDNHIGVLHYEISDGGVTSVTMKMHSTKLVPAMEEKKLPRKPSKKLKK